jgi:hydrogenase expression/formation protein HypC
VICEQGHCITCSDEGIELRVLALDGDTAQCVDAQGEPAAVDLALVDAGPGDTVLAHAGVAIARLG